MSNIVKLLASILGALTLFGCVSSSSDNEEAPSAGAVHPVNWMEIHKVDALADLDSCRNCHGFNLDGGSSGVSCLVCHPGAPGDFSDFHDVKVTMAPSCSECHVATGATVDPNDDKVHNSCTVTCHDANYQLVSPPPARAPLHNAIGGDCTACHDVYFDNHIHGEDENHDVLMRDTDQSNGADCNTCHGMFVNNWAGILGVHLNDCAKCHSSSRTTNLGVGFSSVKNVIAIGVTVACLDCHADKTIAHGTDHFGLSYVTGVANCTSCHGNGTDIDSNYITLVHLTCGKCHVNPGGGGPLHDYSATGGTISDNVDYSAFAGGGSCATCHVRYDTDFAAGHQIEDHSGITTSPTCITTCHTAASAALIISTTHNNTCTSCHVNLVADGSLKAGANGTAASHTLGTPSACVDCHEDGVTYIYGTNFNSHDQLTLHSGINTTVGCVAAGCHDTALDGLTTVTQTHNDTCSTCHTNISANGTLKVGAGGRGDASGHVNGAPPSTCESCHTDHFADWFFHNLDHTPSGFSYVLVNSDTSTITVNCVSCHTGDVITAVHDRAATGGTTSCQKCHDAAGALIGNAVAGGGECINCHVAYFDGHTHGANANHDVLMRGTDKSGVPPADFACNICHRRGGTTNLINPLFTNTWISDSPNLGDEGILALHQNSCDLCHNSTRTMDVGGGYTSVQDAILTGVTVGCLDCHASRVNDHNINHSTSRITGVPQCTSCHGDGTVSDANYISNIHGALGCGTCHVNVAGSGPLHDYSVAGPPPAGPLGGTIADNVNYEAINGGAGGSCVTCHDRYGINFQTGHLLITDHQNSANVNMLGSTTNCATTCHDGSTLGVIRDTLHPACTTCHSNMTTDGSLKNAANGNASTHVIGTASTCVTCHSTRNTNFNAHLKTTDHQNSLNADMLTATANCTTTCHDGSTLAAIRDTLHPACTSCHTDIATDGTLKNAANGNASTHVIGTASTCVTCHSTRNTNFNAHLKTTDHQNSLNADMLTATANCTTTCHDGSTLAAIRDTLHPACTSCHTNIATDGTLKNAANGNASTHVIGTASTCATCHSTRNTNFNAHLKTTDHQNSLNADMLTATANCTTTCHDGSTLAAIHDTLHPACTSCHTDIATDGTLKNAANGNASTHVVGTASSCADCHINRNANFNAHLRTTDHQNSLNIDMLTTSANCTTNCHDGSTLLIIRDTLHSSCTKCHANLGADGTLNNAINGNARLHVLGTASPCATCHPVYNTNFKTHDVGDHKNGVTDMLAGMPVTGVATNDCTASCHPNTLDTILITLATGHGDDTIANCVLCHTDMATNGSLLGSAVGHILGVQSTCGDCHTPTYFNSHDHGTSGGTVQHDLTYVAGTDISQVSNPAPCGDCHDGNNADANGIPLDSWEDILSEHLVSCSTCHDYIDDGNATPPQVENDATISSRVGNTCTTCHTPKLSPAVSSDHGGHAATDFGWDATTQTTCGSTSCHDFATNSNVVANIHKGICINCHNNAAGGAGTAIVGANGLGDARLATLAPPTPPHSENCLVCHGAGYMTTLNSSSWDEINNPDPGTVKLTTYGGKHHTNANAQAGTCTWCHTDPRPAPGWNTVHALGVAPDPGIIPQQLACRTCHSNFADAGLDLIIYENWFSDGHAGGGGVYDAGNNYTSATKLWSTTDVNTLNGKEPRTRQLQTHLITATGAKILVDNFGICFSCHDGVDATRTNVWHAKQTAAELPAASLVNNDNTDAHNFTIDILRQGPGRKYFNLFQGPYPGDTNMNDATPFYAHGQEAYRNGGVQEIRGLGIFKDSLGKRNSATFQATVDPAYDSAGNAQWSTAGGDPDHAAGATFTVPCFDDSAGDGHGNDVEGNCATVGNSNVPIY